MDLPTREIFWLIGSPRLFYGAALVSLLIAGWGFLRAIRFVQRGAAPPEHPARRMGVFSALAEILSHRRLRGENSARLWHLLIFMGFSLLLFVTCYLMLAHYGLRSLLEGAPYLLLSLVADLAGMGLVAGACLALVDARRISSAEGAARVERILVLSLLLLICLTGFLVEGLRMRLEGDPWGIWSPVGSVVSRPLGALGVEEGRFLFKISWWVHSILALGLVAWIPFSSRLRHMLFLPLHRPLTPVCPASMPAPVDLQSLRLAEAYPQAARLGIEAAGDATRKQRLAMLACMDCGRCETLCPAFQTGQPLSPRKALQDLRRHVLDVDGLQRGSSADADRRPAEAVTPSSLWACRLCRACEEKCPAGIGHAAQILELRQAEVLGRGKLPDDAALALRNLARTGSPYGVSAAERSSWCRQNRIPDALPETGTPWLLWTGCFPPGDEQRPRVLSVLVSLLRELGVPFFALQGMNACCGEPARVLGEEDLFQAIARNQIRALAQAGAGRILVHCPHCYTVLKDVYPLFGAGFSVVHTSDFFLDVIQKGHFRKRRVQEEVSVVYHDPCFLGRYQDLYEPPRAVLRSCLGLEVLDPPRSREAGFCCGAGGGHFFMDLDVQERPASQRMTEILAQGAGVLSVSCSFCFSMFDDALRRLPEPAPIRIADWLELIEEAVTFETLPPDRSVSPASRERGPSGRLAPERPG